MAVDRAGRPGCSHVVVGSQRLSLPLFGSSGARRRLISFGALRSMAAVTLSRRRPSNASRHDNSVSQKMVGAAAALGYHEPAASVAAKDSPPPVIQGYNTLCRKLPANCPRF
jgi:hypothetical protein